MPQFTKPTLTNKRKYDESNDTTTSSYKRQSTGQGSTHVSHDSTHNQSRDRFWYVQWYVITSASQDYLYLITLGVIPNKRQSLDPQRLYSPKNPWKMTPVASWQPCRQAWKNPPLWLKENPRAVPSQRRNIRSGPRYSLRSYNDLHTLALDHGLQAQSCLSPQIKVSNYRLRTLWEDWVRWKSRSTKTHGH